MSAPSIPTLATMPTTWKKMSWEFPYGTEKLGVVNPVKGYLKMILDKKRFMLYVFHEKGKDAVPLWKLASAVHDVFPKSWIQETNMSKPKWSALKAQYAASRICIEDSEGRCKCMKSRMLAPTMENAAEILDIAKSKLEFSVRTGLEAAEVCEEEIML